MDGRSVQRIFTALDPQKSGRMAEDLFIYARNAEKRGSRSEKAVPSAMVDNASRQPVVETRNVS